MPVLNLVMWPATGETIYFVLATTLSASLFKCLRSSENDSNGPSTANWFMRNGGRFPPGSTSDLYSIFIWLGPTIVTSRDDAEDATRVMPSFFGIKSGRPL